MYYNQLLNHYEKSDARYLDIVISNGLLKF